MTAEGFAQYSRLANECPNALRLGVLRLVVFDQVSPDVMRNAIKAVQRSYMQNPKWLHEYVASDSRTGAVVAIQCHAEDPTSRKLLQAVLFVVLNDERKPIRLCATTIWCRYVGGQREIDDTPLWSEFVELEDDASVPASIASDEAD
jgi:hypothetical protein